ncbi:hypothetical protein TWF102_009091 [Orbilia oligospora]|uniref:F-box domain-containing protein n=1 Tax=Orbilia oligospora TaxID=2813651 RepID=A0A7C8JFW9_ORBOL|nr:hypothetical protein TWF103_005973 [Orbilia oligospora]KAF3109821.1 hypothetical protein TWF102_009091 [Orbilia oligospora]KAF3116898.1 hypothetical protein TWF706_000115 [Orbilia oligospora]KAF3142227.1 hypothetical protein TWF594_005588 [Orbilia oligospora]
MTSQATPCLISVLSNSLIFNLIIPRVPIQSLLALLSTSHSLRSLLKSSPDTFRYLDFTDLPVANVDRTPLDTGGISWRAERMDEALTEEEFFSGPLRGIFYSLTQQKILQNVSTLILDGMAVTTDILEEITLDTSGGFNVRILSVRGCFKFNYPQVETKKILQIIRLAVTRPKPPRLKALYILGCTTPITYLKNPNWRAEALRLFPEPVAYLPEDPWYLPLGCAPRQIIDPLGNLLGIDAEKIMKAAEGVMKFDFMLCRGPNHDPNFTEDPIVSQLATLPLGFGCMGCGSSPEGPGVYGKTPSGWLPLLAPPPITTSSVEAAWRPPKRPDGKYPELYARCYTCIQHRRCIRCRDWICENCADDTEIVKFIARFVDVEAGIVPAEYLQGVMYNWEGRPVGRHGEHDMLCLRNCMKEVFGYRRESEFSGFPTTLLRLQHVPEVL